MIGKKPIRGIYGIFINDDKGIYCAYIGRASNMYCRFFSSSGKNKGHLVNIKNGECKNKKTDGSIRE